MRKRTIFEVGLGCLAFAVGFRTAYSFYHFHQIKRDFERVQNGQSIASVVSIWESAHFHEREAFEMFGITFEGHPDLRKLLTLDNWDGPPPMLKDIRFPEMGQR